MKQRTFAQHTPLSAADFKRQAKHPVVVVLDNIRSGHNTGAAFRISDAFLMKKIYLCGITPRPPHAHIRKTALGAEQVVAWEYASHTTELILELKRQGYKIITVEQTDLSIPLQNFNPTSDSLYALIFGNEVFGVSKEVLALADKSIEIPQYGTKHSLNVSTCIGIVAWHLQCRLPTLSG